MLKRICKKIYRQSCKVIPQRLKISFKKLQPDQMKASDLQPNYAEFNLYSRGCSSFIFDMKEVMTRIMVRCNLSSKHLPHVSFEHAVFSLATTEVTVIHGLFLYPRWPGLPPTPSKASFTSKASNNKRVRSKGQQGRSDPAARTRLSWQHNHTHLQPVTETFIQVLEEKPEAQSATINWKQ